MVSRSSVFKLQLCVIKVKLRRSSKRSRRSAGKALHPGEPRAKSIEVFEKFLCILYIQCVCVRVYFVYIYIDIDIYRYIYIYVCMYVCMHICVLDIYVYIHM